MPRARAVSQPFPAAADAPALRPWLRPFRVLDAAGRAFTLPTDVLLGLSQLLASETAHPPSASGIARVSLECDRACGGHPLHVSRLLAAGTLALPVEKVGQALTWLDAYLVEREGGTAPAPTLDEALFAWTGDAPDVIVGVVGHRGALCWWDARVRPGEVEVGAPELQARDAFTREGPPLGFTSLSAEPEVEAALRRLAGA
jgi:hypothetical protein